MGVKIITVDAVERENTFGREREREEEEKR